MTKAKTKSLEEMSLKDALAHALRQQELWANKAAQLRALMTGGDNFPATAKKPGPKPGAKAAPKKTAAPVKKGPAAKKVAQTAAPKKKAAPKAQAKPPVKKAASTAAAPVKKKGSGKPRLIDALQLVMAGTVGKKSTMNAVDCHAELKKRHWLPDSDDPLGYVRYSLSANKDIFLRDPNARGQYYLDKAAKNGAKTSKKTTTAAPAAPKSAPAPKAEPAPKVEAEAKAPEVEAQPPAPEPTPPPAAPKSAPKVEVPKVEAKAPEAPKAPVAPPKVEAAPKSKPAGEDEDPEAVANEILKGAGIDMSGPNPFS